ncbi:hypothetical protein Bca101_008777 [Brassica carinata]
MRIHRDKSTTNSNQQIQNHQNGDSRTLQPGTSRLFRSEALTTQTTIEEENIHTGPTVTVTEPSRAGQKRSNTGG